MKLIPTFESFLNEDTSKIRSMEPATSVNEDVTTDVAKVRKAMEDAINKIRNPKDIERRINNVKFVIYNSLDPDTNGGERPKPGFKFDNKWWDSTHNQATDSVIASIYGELDAAVKGKSFGERTFESVVDEAEEFMGYKVGDDFYYIPSTQGETRYYKIMAITKNVIKLQNYDFVRNGPDKKGDKREMQAYIFTAHVNDKTIAKYSRGDLSDY